MADRYSGVVVTFERDIRDEDADPILAAIRQLRGVITVKPLKGNAELHIAQERIRHEMFQKLLKVLE